jgi:UDP-glucose 4-epimerase
MKVLLTGGAGYIGSHTAVELLEAGHEVVIIDNLSNSSKLIIDNITEITGKNVTFYNADVCDKTAVRTIIEKVRPDALMHLAALKAVGESVQKPLAYYRNNIDGTLALLEAMQELGIHKFVFSSSATVYGSSSYPYEETMQIGVGVTSPYGKTKVAIENMLQDLAAADDKAEILALRYFNPVGAHGSGKIGELPQGTPNNLMPFITQVASGKREKLSIFGSDYPTPDGTCVRDYIHGVDVAKGHVAALEHLSNGFDAVNLGSGKGTSVLELVTTFERACGVSVPREFAPRRQGDLAEFYANVEKAKKLWGWQTTLGLEAMCRDTWRWQQYAEAVVG